LFWPPPAPPGGGFFCKENGISIEKQLENSSTSWQYPLIEKPEGTS